MSKKFIYAVIATILFVFGVIAYNYYQKIFGASISKDMELFVYSNDELIDIKTKISNFSKNPNTFLWVAAQKNFSKPKGGRYLLKKGMSNNDLVNMLRVGNQSPVKISFNNQDNLEKFANRIAEQLEIDRSSILNAFTDENFLKKNNFTKKTVLQICLPNTYEFYWNVSAEKFRNKILNEYHRFWNANRLAKAKKLGLSKNEVIILASIVHKETTKIEEEPVVAGLYLNRLKKGWPLQADPTVIYCVKEIKGQDYVVKRVLKKDLEINSPYNTYKFKGLPPSQISMPDINTIDAVLNAQKHNYFYMCADINKIGYHKFAKSLAQHNRNAAKYQNWLNKQGIQR